MVIRVITWAGVILMADLEEAGDVAEPDLSGWWGVLGRQVSQGVPSFMPPFASPGC